MFYAVEVLARKGKLAAPWIAAHSEKRLKKHEILHVSIEKTIDAIEKGKVPELALRTSSHIMLGLSRILFRQVRILHGDCTALLVSISTRAKEDADKRPRKQADSSKVTYEIKLANFLGSITQETSFSASEIEIPRMSLGSTSMMDYSMNYSMSMNDISLADAITFLSKDAGEEGAREARKSAGASGELETSDGIIMQHMSTLNSLDPIDIQDRTHGHIPQMEDPQMEECTSLFRGSASKRSLVLESMLEEHQAVKVKRQRTEVGANVIDKNTSFSGHLITLAQHISKLYKEKEEAEKRSVLLLPKPIKEFFYGGKCPEVHGSVLKDAFDTKKDAGEESAGGEEVKDRSMEIEASGLSIEVPRGLGETEHMPFPADLSVCGGEGQGELLSPDRSVSLSSDAGTYPSFAADSYAVMNEWSEYSALPRREKALSFFSLLSSVTKGRVCARQEEPYSRISLSFASVSVQ
ncbi:hypothetical protein NECID01_0523 [Nematocida sp. AWRm77]|nr:hypothetical protein NECID01_0523 [Nematocida sp. AWRm77]